MPVDPVGPPEERRVCAERQNVKTRIQTRLSFLACLLICCGFPAFARCEVCQMFGIQDLLAQLTSLQDALRLDGPGFCSVERYDDSARMLDVNRSRGCSSLRSEGPFTSAHHRLLCNPHYSSVRSLFLARRAYLLFTSYLVSRTFDPAASPFAVVDRPKNTFL